MSSTTGSGSGTATTQQDSGATMSCNILDIFRGSTTEPMTECYGLDNSIKNSTYAGLAAIAFLLLVVLLLSIAVCCLCARLRKEKRKSRSDPEQGSEGKAPEQEEGTAEGEPSSAMQMSALKTPSVDKEETSKEDKVAEKTAVVSVPVDTDDIMYDTVQGATPQVASTSNAPLPDYDSVDDIIKRPTQAPSKDNNPPIAPPPPPLGKNEAKFELPEYSVVAKKTKPAAAVSETGTYNVLIHDTTPGEAPPPIDQTSGSTALITYSSISREGAVEGSQKSASARNSSTLSNHDPEDDFSPPLPPPISEDDLPSNMAAPNNSSNTKTQVTKNAVDPLYGNANGIKVDTGTKISSNLSGSNPNLLTQQDGNVHNQQKAMEYTESNVEHVEESLYMNC